MAFDGAGTPYRDGPSWGRALVIMIGLIVLATLALTGFTPILPR